MAPRGKAKERDHWMSLNAAAKALGEVRQTVLTRAIAGELEARHVAGRTVIRRASLKRLLASKESAR